MGQVPRSLRVIDRSRDTARDPACDGMVEERLDARCWVGGVEAKLCCGRELRLGGARITAGEQRAAEHAVDVCETIVIIRSAVEDAAVDVDGLRGLARGQQCLGQPDQQLRRWAVAGQGYGRLQAVACSRNRPIRHRRPTGALEHCNCLDIAAQLTAHRVLGSLAGLHTMSKQMPECRGVPSLTDRRGHVLVEGLAKKRMSELRPTRLAGPNQAGVDQNAERLGRLGLAHPGHPGCQHGPELDAENAGGMRVAQISAWAGDARQQDRGLRSAFVKILQAAAVSKMSRDLFQEQGVAAARRPGPTDGLLGKFGAHLLGEQRSRRRRAERHQLLELSLPLLGQMPGEVERRPRPGPEGGDDRDAHRGDAVAQERNERQRVGVRPVQVVEQDERRLFPGFQVA